MLKENDCVSYPHRCQAALRLDSVLLMVKGNEVVSCLNPGQAAEQLNGCRESNRLAPTLVDVQPQCGLILTIWKTKGHHSAQDASLVSLHWQIHCINNKGVPAVHEKRITA